MVQNTVVAVQPPVKNDDDAALIQRMLNKDPDAYQTVMRRYNQRLYRIARAILRDDALAEDAVQEAYLQAFKHLESFRREASLSTWLHQIVRNEALGRLRKSSRAKEVQFHFEGNGAEVVRFPGNATLEDPEKTMAQRQILQLVEDATDELPDTFRLVFVARVIEGLSVEETAELLMIKPATVRSRLHRARDLLRRHIDNRIGPVLLDAFPFAGKRCDRLTANVMQRLGIEQ